MRAPISLHSVLLVFGQVNVDQAETQVNDTSRFRFPWGVYLPPGQGISFP